MFSCFFVTFKDYGECGFSQIKLVLVVHFLCESDEWQYLFVTFTGKRAEWGGTREEEEEEEDCGK